MTCSPGTAGRPRAGSKPGQAGLQGVEGKRPHPGNAVRRRLARDAIEARRFFLRPGDEHGIGLEERQPELAVDGEIGSPAGLHEAMLRLPATASNAVWRMAELPLLAPDRMSGPRLQQNGPQTCQRQRPQDGAADDTTPDYGHIEPANRLAHCTPPVSTRHDGGIPAPGQASNRSCPRAGQGPDKKAVFLQRPGLNFAALSGEM